MNLSRVCALVTEDVQNYHRRLRAGKEPCTTEKDGDEPQRKTREI